MKEGPLHTPAHKQATLPTLDVQRAALLQAPPQKCAKEGCERAAQCVPGVLIFPHKAVMEHYKTDTPLTRMIMNLMVCRECIAALTFKDLMTPDQFMPVVQMIEQCSGTKVDIEATKIVAVEFDDPEYVNMKAQADNPPPEPPVG